MLCECLHALLLTHVKEQTSLYEIVNHPNIVMWVAIQTRKRVLMTVMHFASLPIAMDKTKRTKKGIEERKQNAKST